jgi:hypothetical protein
MNTKLKDLEEILKSQDKTKEFLLDKCKFKVGFLLENKDRIKKIYETLLKERKNTI